MAEYDLSSIWYLMSWRLTFSQRDVDSIPMCGVCQRGQAAVMFQSPAVQRTWMKRQRMHHLDMQIQAVWVYAGVWRYLKRRGGKPHVNESNGTEKHLLPLIYPVKWELAVTLRMSQHTVADLHQHREVGGQPLSLQPPGEWELGAEQQSGRSERWGGQRQGLQQHRHLQAGGEKGEMYSHEASPQSSCVQTSCMFNVYSRRETTVLL